MKNICNLLIIALLLIGTDAYAQKKNVSDVKGRYPITREISQAQAEQLALREAKQEALRKAGVAEQVWSALGLVTSSDNQSFSEAYSEVSTVYLDGLLVVTAGPVYSEEVDPASGVHYAVATIDAEVKASEKQDKTYIVDVKGIAPVYSVGEKVNFTVDFYGSDSYLKIFWFDTAEGAVIYPFSNPQIREENEVFKSGMRYPFPRIPSISYRASKVNPEAPVETVYLLIVATKKYYPFLNDKVTFKSVFEWLYNIPASERTASKFMIQIK